MDNGQFTIGITAYRVAEYLEECWQSVLEQTDSSWRAVMVLDGGNDEKTRKVFRAIKHPRLMKVELDSNQGPYATRAAAIENCPTPWYCQLDGDDTFPADAIENLSAAVGDGGSPDFFYGHTAFFNDHFYRLEKVGDLDPENLVVQPLFNAASPISINLYRKLGGYCDALKWINADWDFWIGAHEMGAIGQKVNAVLYNRRLRDNNIGQTQFQKRAEAVEHLIRRHPGFFKDKDRERQCRGNVYEKTAREYRRRGNRSGARLFAERAISQGLTSSALKEIIEEGEMPLWRYQLRRLARRKINGPV